MWRKHTDKDITVNGAHRYKADRREAQRLKRRGDVWEGVSKAGHWI